MQKPKKQKFNCIVCELHPFESFVAFDSFDELFETQEEWQSRWKSHIRSLCHSAAQEEYSWKLCRKHQEQLQSYLMEHHADEIVKTENFKTVDDGGLDAVIEKIKGGTP